MRYFARHVLLLLLLFSFGRCVCPDVCRCSSEPSSSTESDITLQDCFSQELSRLPGIFPTTQWLNLSDNQLTYIDESSFRGVQYLEVIDLSYNFISTLNVDTFRGLPFLQEVNLTHNRLQFVSLKAFESLQSTNNPRIHWSGNPWHCNCPLQTAWKAMNNIAGVIWGDIICKSPSDLFGKKLENVGDLCEDKLTGHDIAIVVMSGLSVVVALVLNFWHSLKGLLGYCNGSDADEKQPKDTYLQQYDEIDYGAGSRLNSPVSPHSDDVFRMPEIAMGLNNSKTHSLGRKSQNDSFLRALDNSPRLGRFRRDEIQANTNRKVNSSHSFYETTI